MIPRTHGFKSVYVTIPSQLLSCVRIDICDCLLIFQMAIENKIRQRLDLQSTRRQQLEFKEQKRQAEREEEDEFRRKVQNSTMLTEFTRKKLNDRETRSVG